MLATIIVDFEETLYNNLVAVMSEEDLPKEVTLGSLRLSSETGLLITSVIVRTDTEGNRAIEVAIR